jgi:hypothetical protein
LCTLKANYTIYSGGDAGEADTEIPLRTLKANHPRYCGGVIQKEMRKMGKKTYFSHFSCVFLSYL